MTGFAQLDLPPDTAAIGEARRFLVVTLDRSELDTLFLVAVTEVITNAIEEHHRIGSADPVTIEVDTETGTVRVTDRGRGYAPTAAPVGPDPLATRGRGLVIARAIVPGFRWEPNQPTGTVFILPYP